MTKEIKMLLIKKNLSKTELASRIGCSSQNLYNKMARDNFSIKELEQIATALKMKLEISFKDNNDEITYTFDETNSQ